MKPKPLFTQFHSKQTPNTIHFLLLASAVMLFTSLGLSQGANRYAEKHPQEILVKNLFPINGKDIIKGYAFFVAVESHVDKAIKTILSDEIAEIDLATDLSKGSNGMVISGEMMEDGKTTLMMNPHLPMYGLASMFEAHLVSNEGLNIHGAILHGGVSCFLGVNENLAWTSTTNNIDKNDTYQLEINPENKLQYSVDGKWLTLTEKKQKLKAKILGVLIRKCIPVFMVPPS
jgi:acyl-homoserine-lactone acylase